MNKLSLNLQKYKNITKNKIKNIPLVPKLENKDDSTGKWNRKPSPHRVES